ncbi:helix-turn-helix domain-containing protein [Pedobacter sp.]|uniref:helix-turn-helix domain-containing protein n=1 Tax=Pedobacter sp. TaxID=1411316 RepID=UPI00396CB16D
MDEQVDIIAKATILIKKELLLSLDKFKTELLHEVKALANKGPFEKKWMKSDEVRKLLGLSHGKLQTMRNTGIIKFARIGGSIYYDRQDIVDMFERNRVKIKNRG